MSLYELVSLINVSNITFRYQCCDTMCTFPGETCDRTRVDFCICKPCTCNDSLKDAGECKAHCNIAKFRNHVIADQEQSKNNETEDTKEDCKLITKFGIASFCGNVIGIIIIMAFVLKWHLKKYHPKDTIQPTQETESMVFLPPSDSGIIYESSDETETSTTLREFNTRRIITSTTADEENSAQVISGKCHDNKPEMTKVLTTV